MYKEKKLSRVLSGKLSIGKYSTTNYRIIDKSTTDIVGEIKRFDERKTGFNKAARGEYGQTVKGPLEKIKNSTSLDKSSISYFFLTGKIMSRMPSLGGRKNIKNIKSDVAHKATSMSKSPMSLLKADHNTKPKFLHSDLKVVSRHIKNYGVFMGADIVGICEVPDYAYYSHDKFGNPVEKKYKYAVCLLTDQDYDTLDASTGRDWISAAQSYMSYSKAAFTASAMSEYIQMLGFEAKDNHLMDYQVIIPPLLELAGLGEMGRHGVIINPSLGSRFKASVVLTNMPLAIDKPIEFGVQEFCKVCKKCAIECPSQSISKSDYKMVHNGYEKYDFDYDNCSKFRLNNPKGSSCGNCIKVCPFNKAEGWTHDLIRWTIRNFPFMNRLIVWGDDLLGYGKTRPEKKWWFDLE